MASDLEMSCPECGGYVLAKSDFVDCGGCGVALEWDEEEGQWQLSK